MRKCQTNVPHNRPFCTKHNKMLPYDITKDFWYVGTAEDAIKRAIVFLDKAEDYSK